ncbi:MAG: SAM-dependent chlorinase/fluorinase [Saprospiraceae bacterium]|nr:SAM-dependent chlorinase/fluorinase [Saprospiraceae bacterium]
MRVVTLISDLGLKDYYVAVIKATILSSSDGLAIVDISHDIPSYDLVKAAYMLKNCYAQFPKGSIHLAFVDNASTHHDALLVLEYDGYYFVAPDNGFFSILFQNATAEFIKIKYTASSLQYVRDKYAEVVACIHSGGSLLDLGETTSEVEERLALQPVVSANQLRGTIIHIDQFDNVIVNVSKDLFERVRQGREFDIFFKRFDPIKSIHTHYYEVAVGELLCLFNSANLLEIAVNSGKAAELFGLEEGDIIQIDFN